MKTSGKQAETFLVRPDPRVRAVLIYGPDSGLVRERASALTRSVVGDADDPFRIGEIDGSELRSDAAKLTDEAFALSFSGGDRIVRVRGAGDFVGKLFAEFLPQADGCSLIVVDAGELGPRSSLRKAFEVAPNAMAIPCYVEEGSSLRPVIVKMFEELGVNADPDALEYLSTNLGGDRGLVHRELEKLATYVRSAESEGSANVSIEDAIACLGGAAPQSLDQLCYAVGDGDSAGVDSLLSELQAEGVQSVAVIRAVQRHFQRLHFARGLLDRGRPAGDAVAALRPPVFFKLKGRFQNQLRAWTAVRMKSAFDVLQECEIACKSSGMPVEATCSRGLLRISQMAR